MKVLRHPDRGKSMCRIVGNWTYFSFVKTFHLSPKRLSQFQLEGSWLASKLCVGVSLQSCYLSVFLSDCFRWNRRCCTLPLVPQWRKSLVVGMWNTRCLAQLRSETILIHDDCLFAEMRCLKGVCPVPPLVLLPTPGGRMFDRLPVSCVVLLRSRPAHISWAGAPEDQNHRGERSTVLSSLHAPRSRAVND